MSAAFWGDEVVDLTEREREALQDPFPLLETKKRLIGFFPRKSFPHRRKLDRS